MEDLYTDRLIMNKITLNDAHEFFKICGKEEITTSFMMDLASNVDEARSMIESIINNYEDESYCFWALRLKEGNIFVGILMSYEAKLLELGYAIVKEHQNKGYATEALDRATSYFFTKGNAKEILLGTFIDNYASIRVMEKSNYHFFKLMENEFFYCGKTRNIVYYIKKR